MKNPQTKLESAIPPLLKRKISITLMNGKKVIKEVFARATEQQVTQTISLKWYSKIKEWDYIT